MWISSLKPAYIHFEFNVKNSQSKNTKQTAIKKVKVKVALEQATKA
jgi:hypothetical protein